MLKKNDFEFPSFILLFLFCGLFTNLSLSSVFVGDLVAALIFIFIILHGGISVNIGDSEKSIYFLYFIFTCYSIFIVIFHTSDYFNEILRNARGIMYFFIVSTLYSKFGERLPKALIFFICVHSIFVISGALNKTFFELIAPLIQYEKLWWFGRGNGLTTSFDTAGFLIVIGVILLSKNISTQKTLLAFILLVSGFFTGRTFMVIGPIAFLFYHFIFQKSRSLVLLSLSFVVVALFAFLFQQFYPFFDFVVTLGKGDGYYDTTGRLVDWGSQVVSYITLFGTGESLLGIDLGYLKALHFGGVLYFLCQLFIVFFVPLCFGNNKNLVQILFFVLIFLVYNVKIYSFISSIYMPAFYLTIFYLSDSAKFKGSAPNV